MAPEKNVKPSPSRIDAIAQPQNGACTCHITQVEQGRDEQRAGAEQEREAAAARVGHHAGGDLEQHLPDAEEGVRREGLGVAEARVEQEQRVDAPDERGRQGREQGQHKVGALDTLGRSSVEELYRASRIGI